MPWTPPPTFSTGQVLTATDLNILSEDVDFLKGRGDAPSLPFLTPTLDVAGNMYLMLYHKYRYIHYEFFNNGSNNTIKLWFVDGGNFTRTIYSNTNAPFGLTWGYVDTNPWVMAVGTKYLITFEKTGSFLTRLNMLEARDTT
jgi:hypothetical protein